MRTLSNIVLVPQGLFVLLRLAFFRVPWSLPSNLHFYLN